MYVFIRTQNPRRLAVTDHKNAIVVCAETFKLTLPCMCVCACERWRAQDPRQFAVKDHNAIILRSETFQQKMEWLVRLSKASERPKPPPPRAKVQTAPSYCCVFCVSFVCTMMAGAAV